MDQAADRFLAHYRRRVADLTQPFDGVEQTLRTLKAEEHASPFAPTNPRPPRSTCSPSLGLGDLFDGIAGGDTFPVRKPDPGHLTGLLDRLGVTPEDALMIGDNEHDAATARAAGVLVLLMSYGYARLPLAEIDADGILERFGDLLDRLP